MNPTGISRRKEQTVTKVKRFPTTDVFRITGVEPSPICPRFYGLSADKLKELVSIGVVGLADHFNASPTVGEMLERTQHSVVTFEGYIVGPPRHDCRVTVDGFSVTTAHRTEADIAYAWWQGSKHEPDETTLIEAQSHNRFSVRLWWD